MNKDTNKWGFSFLDSNKMLAKLNLTQREYRVFHYMVSLLNNNNRLLSMSQKDMAEDMGMAPSHLSVTIKSLIKKHILIHPDGKKHLYLNAEIIQYGKSVPDFTKTKKWLKEEKDNLDEEINKLF